MGGLVESRFPRVASLKRCCGFNTGAQWHMLPQSYPNYKTVHRRFQTWCRRRANRIKPPTQDRRRLSRYMRRWLVERFFAWIQWQRRILVRWEFHAQNFLGFVQLACLVILFRQF